MGQVVYSVDIWAARAATEAAALCHDLTATHAWFTSFFIPF